MGTIIRNMKLWGISVGLSSILLALFFAAMQTPAQAAESLCAEVKLEIKQELTLERQAFDAHMRINNGLSNITLENIDIDVIFTDEDGNPVTASFDPNADPETTGARFFISVDSMDNISDVDGQGQISPSTSADIHWLIIPVPGASGGEPYGKLYYVGAKLTYDIGGEENITEVTPDYIYVKPMPELALDYFIPEQVYGDDAFTAEIEPSVPFSLGLRVKNIGAGWARNLKIDSAQPKITENSQGLLIGFAIESTEVDGVSQNNDLLVRFGDIPANGSAVARWLMTCTLSGRFIEFTASVSHADELGGELTSLIQQENVRTHIMIQDVLSDLPGRDAVPDFLCKDGADLKLFESEGADTIVADMSGESGISFQGTFGTQVLYSLATEPAPGFGYIKLPDPENGSRILKGVIRSDGKEIKTENAWLSKTRKANPADGWDYFVSLFDSDTTPSYTVIYDDPGNQPQAPVLAFIPDRTGIEGQPISFLVEASDPNGTFPDISASPLPAGAGLTDNNNGTGIFEWMPSIGQAGTYGIMFTASDGKLEDRKRASLTVYPHDDTDGDGMNDDWEMANFGTLDRDGTGDFDGDGISDLLEFLMGTDPTKEDTPPSVPVIQSPSDNGEVTGLSPELTIENSTDADGDTLSYEFEVYTDNTLTGKVAAQNQVAEGTGSTRWTVPVNLVDNTGYVWRVRAFDGAAYSLWAYGRFFVNTVNDAPGHFFIRYPADGTEVDTLTPGVQVSVAVDADQDDLTYGFEIYADSNMNTMVASVSGLVSNENNIITWPVNPALSDQAAYFFRAVVTDAHGLQTPTPLAGFTVNTTNHAPTAPTTASPADGSEITGTTLNLAVNNATDPDGDTLVYQFEIDSVATFDGPDKQMSGDIAQGTGTTAWQSAALADNTRYFWRVRAFDGAAHSPWASGSIFVNRANDNPDRPVVENPGQNAWVTTRTPALSAASVSDPDQDGVICYFEVYSDSAMATLVADGAGTALQWTLPVTLSDNTRYYWRVQAEDEHGLTGEWSETAVFFVHEMEEQPESIDISVKTSQDTLLSGILVYAFTGAGSYTGISAATDEDGIARFNPGDFSGGVYKFRADYLGKQFWSADVDIPGAFALEILIAEEPVGITVITAAGPAEGVKVYVFGDTGTYLSLNGTTDADGQVSFNLPSGYSYDFRADLMGSQYWSGVSPIVPGGANQFTVDCGGGLFAITVQEDPQTPMPDLRVYLFHESGSYLNLNAVTDAQGKIGFDVPSGMYRVRADYLGYQFWSSDTLITTDTDIELTIPHQDVMVTVNGLYQSTPEPVAATPAYLFTSSGTYMNQDLVTDTDGNVVFHLPDKAYKVRADYRGLQFWSGEFAWQDMSIDIALADAEVRVGWGDFSLLDVPVYVFNAGGTYMNMTGTTDSEGKVLFRLPAAGAYKFRADYQTGQHWSNESTLVADQVNPVAITTGGGTFAFTVLKEAGVPIVGVNCYVFNQSGTFFGVFGPSSSEGEVTFDLADGNYNIRVDYLGYSFWSPLYDVPDILSDTFMIPHQDSVITVNGVYQSVAAPVENIPVYLFTSTGIYQNQMLTTDQNGQVTFNLPDQPYKIRADYLSRQFWSEEFTQQDKTIDIPMADAEIMVTGGGQVLQNVPVYVFTPAGAYLGITANTDGTGKTVFRLPAGSYKFRTDYQSSQYWSDEETLSADQVNPVEISTGGGPFVFTVLKGENNSLTGAPCYVFSDTGTYLNLTATTSSEGQVSFELADGAYRFRVDYLGYSFWSPVYQIPDILTDTFLIPHQDVVITVDRMYQGIPTSLEGIPVYLFTSAGANMNQSMTTDSA